MPPHSPKRFKLAVIAFKNLARYTWRNLAKRHELAMRWPEIAITNELVYRLAKANLPHVQIYEAINEKIYGHDIDLYVEVLPGRYVLLCLQAKVMYPTPQYTRYHAIDHQVTDSITGSKIYQWELLNRHPADRIPFYLFYNGFSLNKYSASIKPLKRMLPSLSIRGCSIMCLADFQHRFLTKSWKLRVPKRDVNYLSVNDSGAGPDALPWHHLFDLERWLSAAAKASGGLKIKTHAKDSLIDSQLYRKLRVASKTEAEPEFDDFPDNGSQRNTLTTAAFRVLVSLSAEEISESRKRKLELLLAE